MTDTLPLTPPVEGAIYDKATDQWLLNGEPLTEVTISQDARDIG